MQPLISIIIPIYNTSAYLCGCLDSIISQSFTDFELILVDDGSRDDSFDICQKYAMNDSRVKVIHQENLGVSIARNHGLEQAKGKYVYFPDSDDVVMENALQLLVNTIGENSRFAVGGYQIYNEEGICTYLVDNVEEGYMSRDEMLMQFFAPSPYIYQGYLWNKLFTRSIIEKNNIRFEPNIKFNEDRLFCVRYICSLASEEQICYNWKPVYQYVMRSTSAMSSLNQRFNPNFITDLIAFVKIREFLKRSNCDSMVLSASSKNMLCSYARFISMMNQFHVNDIKLKCEAIILMVQGIGIFSFILYCAKKIYRKSLNIIKL